MRFQDLKAGLSDQSSGPGETIAPVVMGLFVVPTPKGLQSRDREDRHAARAQGAEKLTEGGTLLRQVLQHVEEEQGIGRSVPNRETECASHNPKAPGSQRPLFEDDGLGVDGEDALRQRRVQRGVARGATAHVQCKSPSWW